MRAETEIGFLDFRIFGSFIVAIMTAGKMQRGGGTVLLRLAGMVCTVLCTAPLLHDSADIEEI